MVRVGERALESYVLEKHIMSRGREGREGWSWDSSAPIQYEDFIFGFPSKRVGNPIHFTNIHKKNIFFDQTHPTRHFSLNN